jgi:hypothetical protein
VLSAAPADPPDATPWVTALKHGPYDTLGLAQRLQALTWLCGLVGEGLGVRNLLEGREREAAALKKQLLEDARVRGGEGVGGWAWDASTGEKGGASTKKQLLEDALVRGRRGRG